MNITEEEFKASITDKSKRVYMEIALSDLLDIDFDEIHNNIIVDNPDIVNDESIPISKRPHCTILTFSNRIVIIFKNSTIEEKESIESYKIVETISKKYPQKLVCAINFNDFET